MNARRGFSLIELLVTLAVVSILAAGMMALLDSANRMSKEQTNLADAQAASRSGIYEISRIVRQGRTGQLSYENAILPRINNAAGTETFTDLAGATHNVRAGTDAIEIRGTFFSDTYMLVAGNVQCAGGSCASGANAITVKIQQQVRLPGGATITNYPSGGVPAMASKTSPFFFVVNSTGLQPITTSNGNTYQIPQYFVGRVNASGSSWYTSDPSGFFQFTMDATVASAKAMNATSAAIPDLPKLFSSGVVDDVVFFVDRGPLDPVANKYLHPVLTQGILDAGTGNWDIQPVAEDVEDLQIAWGVDGSATSGALAGKYDRGVDPSVVDAATAGADEWMGNMAGSAEAVKPLDASATPLQYEVFIDKTYVDPNLKDPLHTFPVAVPALKAVMISLVVKSHDPDMKYQGAGANGMKVFDSTATSISDPSITGLPFRRRVQTMAVNVRNFL